MKALRILIAEDDLMIGTLIADILTEAGHRVCAITATETATVSAAMQHLPDLMIVDVGLKLGSGVAAVEEILRALFFPYFFMTGNVTRAAALRQHAMVLLKPFDEHALFLAMQHTMEAAARPPA
jgi:two-component system, response regulator PdtaR